jgi:hypothetical protein
MCNGGVRIIKNSQEAGFHELMDIDMAEEKEYQEVKPLFMCFYKCLFCNEL